MTLDRDTKLIGLIGSAVDRNRQLTRLNQIFAEQAANYIAIPLSVGHIGKAIDGVSHLGIFGLDVHPPHQSDLIQYLDALDQDAERSGTVNVVTRRNGQLVGGNTAGRGVLRAIEEVTAIGHKRVTLIGADEHASATAFILHDAGAQLTILSDSTDHALELSEQVGGWTRAGNYDLFEDVLSETEIVVICQDIDQVIGPLDPDTLIVQAVATSIEFETTVPQIKFTRIDAWQTLEKLALLTGNRFPIDLFEEF